LSSFQTRDLVERKPVAKLELAGYSAQMVHYVIPTASLKFQVQSVSQQSKRDFLPIGAISYQLANCGMNLLADVPECGSGGLHAFCYTVRRLTTRQL
jgi:hypothetical protein